MASVASHLYRINRLNYHPRQSRACRHLTLHELEWEELKSDALSLSGSPECGRPEDVPRRQSVVGKAGLQEEVHRA